MTNLENKWKDIDTQWWLYKGTLSRQPLSVKYYKNWFNAYKKYVELKDNKDRHEFNDNVKTICYLLDQNLYEISNTISNDMLSVLKISINKIKDGLNNLIKEDY